MENQKFEKEDDIGALRLPDEKKIPCRDCMNRAKDRKFGLGTVVKGATLGVCDAFEIKPDFVLSGGQDCPYYMQED